MHPGGAPSSEAGSLKVLAAGPVLADRRSALWAIYLASRRSAQSFLCCSSVKLPIRLSLVVS